MNFKHLFQFLTEGYDTFNVQQISNFYYMWKTYLDNSHASPYRFTTDLKDMSHYYLKLFKPVVIRQLEKYISRGRIDPDFPKTLNLNEQNFDMLDQLMRKTFRTDMVRRNDDNWGKLTDYLKQLEHIVDVKVTPDAIEKMFFLIDRINNCVHNTKTSIFDKFANGHEVLTALNFAANVNSPKELVKRVDPDIVSKYGEEEMVNFKSDEDDGMI